MQCLSLDGVQMQIVCHVVRHVDHLRVPGLRMCKPMKRGIWQKQ